MSLLALIKGWFGESMAATAHRVHLDPAVYHALNNLTLPTPQGTTQIDHVLVSVYGVFVLESKNIDGWIFGDAHAPQWTVVKPRHRFTMQNPLHQNHRHVKAVAATLGVDEAGIHSVVMFWGDCTFKTPMPPQVMNRGYTGYIKRFDQVLFTPGQVQHMAQALQAAALPATGATRRAHVASLKARYASTTTCPKCGRPLVQRTARSGARAGQRFLGCSGYPRCRHTTPLPNGPEPGPGLPHP